MSKKTKISQHPSMKNHPKIKGGWHIKTKDGSTFSDLTMEEAVKVYNDNQEAKSKIIPFTPK